MRTAPAPHRQLVALSSLALVLSLPFPALAADTALPPGEEGARAALETSPRHGEWVDIPYEGHAPLRSWIVYPERRDKAGVVVVIHEVYGLTDWIRSVTDQLAADGFIAIAPDLLSGLGPGGGGTDSLPGRDEVVKAVRQLTRDGSAARLAAVRSWAHSIPAANGRQATLGFCWGGGRSFDAAAAQPALDAAIVFYGPAPDSATLEQVSAPVQGHYGGDDARVIATIEPAKQRLSQRKKLYEPHVYEGAGHGFLRQQSGRDGANLRASQQAWPAMLAFLRKRLR